MPRALGINAVLRGGVEGTYGVPPAAAAFKQLPFVSHGLGADQPLIEDDQLGTGREPLDPTPDVVTNDGDVVVPVDTRAFGIWLRLLFGPPTTTGAGPYTHVFTSGGAALPSMSLETGHPEIPSFFTNFGVVGNQLKIALSRRGLLNATISCIAQGESPAPGDAAVVVSQAPAAAVLRGPRFAQAAGEVSKDGALLAEVVDADFTFSNGYEKDETIRPDGMINGVDALKVMMGGNVTLKFASMAMYNAAGGAPIALNFGWELGAASLLFATPRVFLPRVKRPVSGPGGIQQKYAWQGSGASGHALTVTLVNDVASYA